jgi:serine/threonine-protein kinase RsbW
MGRSVPATAENVSAVRRTITDMVRRAGAGERAVADVALAVAEACGNVVVHAYPAGEVGPLIVEARIERGEVHVVVCDHGRGIAPGRGSPGLGLGLPLITALARTVAIAAGPDRLGTEVRMTLSLD